MDSEATQSADVFRLVAWAHKNQKRLGIYAGAVAVVATGVWLYNWNANHHQAVASEALSELRPAVGGSSENKAVPAEAFVKVADAYPNTGGGARAVLMAATALFDAGKFAEAQAQYERFLRDYGDSSWRVQAQVGVAASLEAAGKIDLALTKYKEILDKRPNDATAPQVKSAMARLYEAQNKPEQALRLYEDLVKARNNDSWTSEAEVQGREIMLKHPELRPPAPAPVTPSPAPMTTAPTPLTVPPVAPTSAVPVAPSRSATGIIPGTNGTNLAKPKP